MNQDLEEAQDHNVPASGVRGLKGRPRGDARKRQILDAALELFSARGFRAVSVADLAKHVGMTQAGLLHHFPTKASLMLAVLQEREDRNQREDELNLRSGLDYFSVLSKTLEKNEKNPALVQLFAVLSAESLSVDHPGHAWFAERYDRTIRETTQAIESLIDETKLPAGANCETVARWIIALADGLRIQWLLRPGSMNRHEHVLQFIQLLEPYMVTPQSESLENA